MKNEEKLLVKFLNEWIPNEELTKFGKESKKKIIVLIQKPVVTKDWIEKEVVKLFAKHGVGFPTPKMLKIFEEFMFLQDSLIRNREKVTGG